MIFNESFVPLDSLRCCLTHCCPKSTLDWSTHGMCHQRWLLLLWWHHKGGSTEIPILINLFPQFSIKFTMRRTGKAAVKNQCCRASSFILPILFWQFFKQKCRLMNLNNKTRLASIFLPLSLTTGHQFDFYKVITRLFSPPKENPTEHISVQLLPSSRACLHLSLEFFQQHLVNEESAGFAINDFAWNPQELKTP